jgi:probable F420-dependent oxidoreductase
MRPTGRSDKNPASLKETLGLDVAIRIPYRGNGLHPTGIAEVARAAEEAGFWGGFVGDHIVWPAISPSELPPIFPGATYGYPHTFDDLHLESVGVLTFVAAVTHRLVLGTAIMVPTYRPPVLLAKQLATLDFLAPGRVMLGVGAGWLTQEFEALGVPFDERGTRLEETVEILRRCWTHERPEFHGRHWSFGPLFFEPRPETPIPIFFGGNKRVAWNRAARMADGWLHSSTSRVSLRDMRDYFETHRPSDMPPMVLFDQLVVDPEQPEDLRGRIEEIRESGAHVVLIRSPYEDESPGALLRLIDLVGRL